MNNGDVTVKPLTEAISKVLFNMCIEKYEPNLMYTRDATHEDNDFRLMERADQGFLRNLTPELVNVQEWEPPFGGCTLTFRAVHDSDEYQFTYPVQDKSVLDAVQYALLNHR